MHIKLEQSYHVIKVIIKIIRLNIPSSISNMRKVMQIACSCNLLDAPCVMTLLVRSICCLGLEGEVVHGLISEVRVLLYSDSK